MLVGILIGQRTPGHTRAEARAFEERIHQRYVDHVAEAGLGYSGVYAVEGLVPGAFGELLRAEGDDLTGALRRDAELETPDDVAAFYAECRSLFWQRGRLACWVVVPDDWPVPGRDDSVRIEFCAAGEPGALAALPWKGEGEPQVEAVRFEVLGPWDVPDDVDVVPADAPAVPATVPAGTTVVFHPFVPAPEPSAVAR